MLDNIENEVEFYWQLIRVYLKFFSLYEFLISSLLCRNVNVTVGGWEGTDVRYCVSNNVIIVPFVLGYY